MVGAYVLGIDGGGTKTDLLLFDSFGNPIDDLRVGPTNHEVYDNGFEQVKVVIKKALSELLGRNHLSVSDIVSSVWGLAGLDSEAQISEARSILEAMGLKNMTLCNDSFLGIKAGTSRGVGICSINGTGTVVTGIDEKGKMIQVGGIGLASGDSAGGGFIAQNVIQIAYNELFRCGKHSSLTPFVMELFEIPSKEFFVERYIATYMAGDWHERKYDKDLIQALFKAADEGDIAATDFIIGMAHELGKSVVGCVLELAFEEEIEIILAGSIWTKVRNPLLLEAFTAFVSSKIQQKLHIKYLEELPAIGAVQWALRNSTCMSN